jgi:hypothetical protein
VSGPISVDTIWSLAGSPHIVTGTVQVTEGVQLTIEPGVTVEFVTSPTGDSFSIDVDGVLRAIGTYQNRIRLHGKWDLITFSAKSQGWDETSQTGSVLKYCDISEGGILCLGNKAPLIENNYIHDAKFIHILNKYAYSRISGNLIVNVDYLFDVLLNNGTFSDNIMLNGYFNLEVTDDTEVRNNIIIREIGTGYTFSVSGDQRIEIVNNTITGPGQALVIGSGWTNFTSNTDLLIERCNISGPIHFFVVSYVAAYDNMRFISNNIINRPGSFSVLVDESAAAFDKIVNFTGNWWGTTDINQIESFIYDHADNGNLPVINFVPAAGNAISNTGARIADAGPDRRVAEKSQVLLDASGSFPLASTYQWRQVSGLPVTLNDVDYKTVSFESPEVESGDSELQFELTVSVESLPQESDRVAIKVVKRRAMPWMPLLLE